MLTDNELTGFYFQFSPVKTTYKQRSCRKLNKSANTKVFPLLLPDVIYNYALCLQQAVFTKSTETLFIK